MNKKLLLATVATVGTSIAAFAEGETSAAQTILSQAQTSLQGLITTATPIVGTIVVAALGIWGAFKMLRLVMKAFGFGSSR